MLRVRAVTVAMYSSGAAIWAMTVEGMMTAPIAVQATEAMATIAPTLCGVLMERRAVEAVATEVMKIMISRKRPPVMGIRSKPMKAPPMMPKPMGRERRPFSVGSLPVVFVSGGYNCGLWVSFAYRRR